MCQRHNNPLNPRCFCLQRRTLLQWRQLKLQDAHLNCAKNCKGDDSTAQRNTKGWGHTNKLKKHKLTHKAQTQAKYTHTKHSAQPGCMNWSWQLCTWKTANVQPKCQGPLQLLSPPFLMISNTKQMRPNGKGGLQMNLTTQVILRQLQAVTCPGNHCGFELKQWNRNAEIRQLLGLESVSLVINQGR